MMNARRSRGWHCLSIVLMLTAAPTFAHQAAAQRTQSKPSGAPVDLNTASQADLEALPGIGPATAKKIIAGRPYATVSDLTKAGVSNATITKITPLVTVGRGGSGPGMSTPRPSTPERSPAAAGATIDLNTASEKELEALPGVGPATAKKIIAGRPYTAVSDVAKAGVPKSTIDKITPLVTVGRAVPTRPADTAPSSAVTPPAPTPRTSTPPTSDATGAQQPPVKGMVWVNLDTKIFHREGDRFYGRTKNGRFMTEADALAAGYREAKTRTKKPNG